MKRNFLALRLFRDLADLNTQAREWVLREAGARIHGTTRKPPLGLFELEAAQLRSLPPIAPELGSWHQVSVHRDCHVAHARALYSVPFGLVGKALWLRATDGAVAIFEDYRLVATHPRARRVGERVTVRDHLPPAAQAFFAQDRRWCETQAAAIGPACARLIAWLLADRILERLRAAQGVIRLAKQFTPERLEIACARALTHDSPYYRTVKTILAGGHDRADADSAATNEIHAPQARFARPAHSLFDPDANTPH